MRVPYRLEGRCLFLTKTSSNFDMAIINRSAAETRFLQWLTDNGAAFPDLEWPADFGSGLRGVRATSAIAPGDEMMRVPKCLMISEALCWSDPQLGRVFAENRDVFARDDPVLALFIVRELVKGEQSFFHPYLAILPTPESVQDWSDAELEELRDRRLVDAARHRTAEIRTFYQRVISRLADRYPGEFPEEQYTLERFAFAWKTIQARTFGRRLPWTALVPFADCLNHANVATKYDFDVDDNGCFRLYPSRSTAYAAGAEAFNSYGRRPNFQLLLDYGFALQDNEWDYVDVEIPKGQPGPNGKRVRFGGGRVIRIDRQSTIDELFPQELLVAIALPSASTSPPPSPQRSTSLADSDIDSAVDSVSLLRGLEWLREILIGALDELGGSTLDDDDETKLRDLPTTTARLRAAITHRMSRRRILVNTLTQLEAKISNCRSDIKGGSNCDDDDANVKLIDQLTIS